MSHEIFFLFSLLILISSNSIKKICAQNAQTGSQVSRKFKKNKTCSANEIHANLMHFDSVTWVCGLSDRAQNTSLSRHYLDLFK